MKVAMHRLLIALLSLFALPVAAEELKIATWNIAWLTTKPAGHPDLPASVRPRTNEDYARLRGAAWVRLRTTMTQARADAHGRGLTDEQLESLLADES